MFNQIGRFFKINAGLKQDRGDQVVIVDGKFDTKEEFGTEEERKKIIKLEDSLNRVIETSGLSAEYDGHDIGEGTFTLYIYGISANEVFNRVKGVLRNSGYSNLEVTLQYGPPEPGTVSKKVSLYE